jgi:hypothetical protein
MQLLINDLDPTLSSRLVLRSLPIKVMLRAVYTLKGEKMTFPVLSNDAR